MFTIRPHGKIPPWTALRSDWLKEILALDSQIQIINGLIGRQHDAAQRGEGEADDVGSGEYKLCFAVRGDTDHAPVPVQAGCDVKAPIACHGQTLWTAEAAEEDAGVTIGLD